MHSDTKRFLCGALVLGLTASAGLAQQITGTIVGTVKDVSGGVISAAVVTVTNEGTNITSKAATEASGDYVASNLLPGAYTVTTEFAGFKKNTVKGVALLANRTVRVDVVLEPGAVTQSVEVQAAAPVLNSESASISSVMESRIITSLPINGRTIDQLIRLSAGVTTDAAHQPRLAGASRRGGTQFNVDGINYNDSENGSSAYTASNGLATLPSIEAISEFKVDSNNMKAELEASSAITIVGKSGSNQFHGSLFEFNRNSAYAANVAGVPANQPLNKFNRNEFGFSVGGPIRKNKTFFFGNYESWRERYPRSNQFSVGTAAMRGGDFAGLPTIVDPLSGAPFPNNRIPAERIDPRSKTLIGYVPLPNLGGVGPAGTLNNWIGAAANISDINRFGARIDHRFSDKDSLWGNFTSSKNLPAFFIRGYPPGYGHGTSSAQTTSFSATEVHTFSPRTLNEIRFAWFNLGWAIIGINTEFDPLKLFPDLYAQPIGGLPNVNISSHVGIGDRGGRKGRAREPVTELIDNFTHVHGRHTLKTGITVDHWQTDFTEYVYGKDQGEANDAAFGRFDFNGRFTNNVPTGTAQPAHAFADFLLGYPTNTYRSTPGPSVVYTSTRYSAYVQDDWQVSSRLTLNLGVRYLLQVPWKARDNNESNFDFASGKFYVLGDKLPPNTIQPLVKAYPIVTSAQAGLPDHNFKIWKNNWGPRLGFAFRPFADAKTVIRGGVGIYYNVVQSGSLNNMGTSNLPFLLAESFESDPGRIPSLTLAKPFAAVGKLSANPSISASDRALRNAVSQQWNLTVERELTGNLGVRVSYVGNKGSHLAWAGRDTNRALLQAPGAVQAQRPYQPWASISTIMAGADSTYHGLQIGVTHRYRRGLTFQAEYSWNRSLDNLPNSGGPQDPYNNRAERGNSDGLRRHVLTPAFSYELPFGPGKPFANVSGVLGKIVGGWQVAGLMSLRTGTPFSVSFSSTQPGWFSSRANAIRDPKLARSERSKDRWFDASAFAVPAPFTYGNSARNLLFGPGARDVDLSLLKDTKITERFTAQLRGEFFNVANHANLGGPSTNISVPATVGKIFGVSGSRQVQFGLKVLF
jgi:hypothetical protein